MYHHLMVAQVFLGLLAIVFITLKLCNVINWSWWWVTAPVWRAIVLGVGIGILALYSNYNSYSIQEISIYLDFKLLPAIANIIWLSFTQLK